MKITLDPAPAHILTDRECAKLLGGIIGCLTEWCGPATVKRAIRWWAENLDAVDAIEKQLKP